MAVVVVVVNCHFADSYCCCLILIMFTVFVADTAVVSIDVAVD